MLTPLPDIDLATVIGGQHTDRVPQSETDPPREPSSIKGGRRLPWGVLIPGLDL